jgi:tRNA-dihydrouridine synthase
MAHVESFLRGSKGALQKIEVRDGTSVQIQLLTGREGDLMRFLDGFESFTGFTGFNLNLSCPSRDVISHGKGAAMVKRTAKTDRFVSIIHNHGYDCSVKIRLGTNEYEKQQKVYINLLKEVNADFFIVHAKTAVQVSRESEDYSVYPECVEAAAGKPIIANGGIDSSEKVKEVQAMGVSGVMIGRAALSNPAVFDVLRNELGFNDPPTPIPGIENLRKEYQKLHSDFRGQEKYSESFNRVLGEPLEREIY